MRALLLATTLLAVAVSVPAEGFWKPQELASDAFAELDGQVQIRFKDGVSAQPVEGLTFSCEGLALVTDAQGVVRFPLDTISDITDKDLPFTASAPGYITLADSLRVHVGTLVTTRFVMTRELQVNQARFVLEWEARPSDLDAWLSGPSFTVSYRSMQNGEGKASLDRDARSGYGPEVITLLKVDPSADYLFSVKKYSNDAPLRNLKVSLYLNNHLERVIKVAQSDKTTLDFVRIHQGKVEVLIN